MMLWGQAVENGSRSLKVLVHFRSQLWTVSVVWLLLGCWRWVCGILVVVVVLFLVWFRGSEVVVAWVFVVELALVVVLALACGD